jgi:hypothetical protein
MSCCDESVIPRLLSFHTPELARIKSFVHNTNPLFNGVDILHSQLFESKCIDKRKKKPLVSQPNVPSHLIAYQGISTDWTSSSLFYAVS